MSPETVADVLANACGHIGSGAEYLYNTVSHLEAKGIHDSGLWQLQRLVAERIDSV
jgi:cation transport protein ChaC